MKKGMSSLVVAILFILITVSLAMMFYTWGLKISKGFESTSKNVVENQISQAKTSFFITAVSGREIGIKNNGEAPLDMSVFDVYINNTKVNITPNVTILQPGSATTLNITSDFTSGNYSIKVSGPFGKTDRIFGYLSTSSKVWFDSNFKYRMPITISSSNNLNNYQVLVVLTPGNFDYSHANSDGSDIRFTDEDKVSSLSHWIEEWNYGSTSKIWVKVPTIPSGSKTIYMYYGNQSSPVTSESDGDSTFLFFDDFSSNSLSVSPGDPIKAVEPIPKISGKNFELRSKMYALRGHGSGSNWGYVYNSVLRDVNLNDYVLGGFYSRSGHYTRIRWYKGGSYINGIDSGKRYNDGKNYTISMRYVKNTIFEYYIYDYS
ncbi:MAG: DUF2341 domain-containing protein, partial [Candidatus Aenigmarchaeota archaeon]|nr:DUF2341 domain-containing protein [Candidatus Aenigmarchaeota archaeon]